ncbi:MAG: polysaccharide biosynthesis tyrosine autokinase, partial [Bacteroidia bacterium]
RSRQFLKRVVDKLDIGITYHSEGTFKSNELYLANPYRVLIHVKDPRVYQCKCYISFNESLSQCKLSCPDFECNIVPGQWTRNRYMDIQVFFPANVNLQELKSFFKNAPRLYFKVTESEIMAGLIQSRLEIKPLNAQAKTLQLKYRDINAQKSSDVVNTISAEYLIYDVDRKSESSKNILSFVNTQLDVVFAELKKTENDLQNFQFNNKLSDKDVLKSLRLGQFSNIEDQLTQIQFNERMLDDIIRNLQQNNASDNYRLLSLISGAENESSIKDITSQLQKLLSEKETLLYSLKPDAEQLRIINQRIEKQSTYLLESLQSLKLRYKTQYKNLLEKSSKIQNTISTPPDQQIEWSRLSRLYTISEKYYTLLLEKKTEYSIYKAGYVSKNTILEKHNGSGVKFAPSNRDTIIIGLLVFVLLSGGTVMVRYLFHDKIISLADVTKHSTGDVALLGIVPKYSKQIPLSQLIVDKNPKSLMSEAFRTLRTNLKFLDSTEGSKIISITSTISGEGKTFVAINMAGILAFTDKKVVILDLDLRKPKIHKGFGVKNEVGMSTILTGLTPLQSCIQNSPMDNLKLITAGPVPPNPSELIISGKLIEILEELKKSFDYIVIDNAPIGLVTDGITTITIADYPIYVFRAEYSRKLFTQILDRLKSESEIRNLSVVLNDVDVNRRVFRYNYGYG